MGEAESGLVYIPLNPVAGIERSKATTSYNYENERNVDFISPYCRFSISYRSVCFELMRRTVKTPSEKRGLPVF
jgi:hypothetical protein